MTIRDAHCHFFSAKFFELLARQSPNLAQETDPGAAAVGHLGWEAPGTPIQLASRWVRELDTNQVDRCALIASVPGDESSVEAAVEAYPDRFVGYAMIDPGKTRPSELEQLLGRARMRAIALFPAMHRFRLDDDQTLAIFEVVDRHPGCSVFVHCGMLTVGIRGRLGLASPFDIRLGNPLDLQRAASAFPDLPILIPHFGAGCFREALMLASLHSNVFFDSSSSNGWINLFPGLTMRQVMDTVIQVMGPRRLLFGTDSSFFPRGWQRPIRDAQLPILNDILGPEEVERVMYRNFDRLFPLPPN